MNLQFFYRGRFASSLAFQPRMKRVFGNLPRAFLPRGGGSQMKFALRYHARADGKRFIKLSV